MKEIYPTALDAKLAEYNTKIKHLEATIKIVNMLNEKKIKELEEKIAALKQQQ